MYQKALEAGLPVCVNKRVKNKEVFDLPNANIKVPSTNGESFNAGASMIGLPQLSTNSKNQGGPLGYSTVRERRFRTNGVLDRDRVRKNMGHSMRA